MRLKTLFYVNKQLEEANEGFFTLKIYFYSLSSSSCSIDEESISGI